MTTRLTSVEAYHEIENNGLLSRRRWQVYKALYSHGPCTANELYQYLPPSKSANAGNITTRLGELRDMNCVDEVGTRVCSVTGKNCIVWDVNGNLPQPPPKRETKDEEIKRLKYTIKELESQNRMYRKMLAKKGPVQRELI